MDVRLEEEAKDFAQVGLKKLGSTDNLALGPVLNGSPEYHTDSSDEETTECSQVGHISANQSLTDEMSASESACLLTLQGLKPTSSAETESSHPKAPAVVTSASSFKNGHVFSKEESSTALPICTPPTTVTHQPRLLCTHSPGSSRFCEAEKKHTSSSSSSKSQHTQKTSTRQIQGAAGDDGCARCILACLFCELLSACSLLIRCLDCGSACEGPPCCCGAGDAECAACGGDACGGDLDCGACCESSSFLELCMECGSICFAA